MKTYGYRYRILRFYNSEGRERFYPQVKPGFWRKWKYLAAKENVAYNVDWYSSCETRDQALKVIERFKEVIHRQKSYWSKTEFENV